MFIVIQKSIEMTAQFLCDDVFSKFLHDRLLIVLCDLDNAVYVTVDVCLVYIL